MPPRILASDASPVAVASDAVVVGAAGGADGTSLSRAAQALDQALEGYLSEHLERVGFGAKEGEVEIVATARRIPSHEIAVVGLGSSNPGASGVRRAAGAAARRLADRPILAAALHEGRDDLAAAAAEGFLLGAYRFTAHKSQPRPVGLQEVLILGGVNQGTLQRAQAHAEATNLARDLTNEPASALTPEALAVRARAVADAGGLECTVLDETELEAQGFGGVLGVGRGSAAPPRLIKLRHAGDGTARSVALVGKGITFDSGGLSIKDARSMETMKTDMAGGAAVIAAMSVLHRLDVSDDVIALVPACENMIGGRALKPGDVVTHYGGRTTEVTNTDAEGRLVLADALALASELDPDAIVDTATLTGGISVALGRKASGLFSTDDELADALESAAAAAGERVWRLPLFDDYRSELDSDVADMKNSAGRYGSSIIAALFLREFVRDGIPWAHVDIAGTARADSDSAEMSRGGTGVATRTLLSWLEARRA
jgi:leucyl aminopeptidase